MTVRPGGLSRGARIGAVGDDPPEHLLQPLYALPDARRRVVFGALPEPLLGLREPAREVGELLGVAPGARVEPTLDGDVRAVAGA